MVTKLTLKDDIYLSSRDIGITQLLEKSVFVSTVWSVNDGFPETCQKPAKNVFILVFGRFPAGFRQVSGK